MDDEGVLVAALVAAESKVGQDYFLFCALTGLGVDLPGRAGREAVLRLGAAFLAAAAGRLAAVRRSAALRFTATGRGSAGRFTATGRGSAAFFASGALRCTSVKRV